MMCILRRWYAGQAFQMGSDGSHFCSRRNRGPYFSGFGCAEELKEICPASASYLSVWAKDELKASLSPRGYEFEVISLCSADRRRSDRPFLEPGRFAASLQHSFAYYGRFARASLSDWRYPTFIPLLTARLMGFPASSTNRTLAVGLANRVLALMADHVFAVHQARAFWRTGVTYSSNPVRRAFYEFPLGISPCRRAFSAAYRGGSQERQKPKTTRCLEFLPGVGRLAAGRIVPPGGSL